MEPFRPSAFTPFLRRFTDERARDLADTKALYSRVRQLHLASPYRDGEGRLKLGSEIYAAFCDAVSEDLLPKFSVCLDEILELERPIFQMPQEKFDFLSLKEATDLRHFLRSKEYFHNNEAKVVAILKDHLTPIFLATAQQLPETFDPSPFTIPLVHALPRDFMDRLIGQLRQEPCLDAGLFTEINHRLYRNVCAVSGIADPDKPGKPFKWPSQSDLTPEEVVRVYFKGTPFVEFLLAPVPLRFTYEERFSHMHVLGGSGAGKTTLLQNLILHDLISEDPPSLVIVDSQGDLISKLSRLKLFELGNPLSERLLMVSPKDIHHPPALNIFDVNRDRLGAYDEATKEQVTAGVIQTFDYLFSGLIGADLTAKQSVFFRFVARLMLALPETMGRPATILDLIALMDDDTPYKEAIASLPPIQRQFFERDFSSKTFAQTKEQIRYRLNAILENPTLARLFTSPRTKLDLFSTLNNGGIVLVDTAKDFLKGASANFGRIFISLVLQAILERAAIPPQHRRPTFLIVDEAASYFDSNIDDLLTEARKYKLGCIFAHQFLDQATASLKASLAANTAIKMAGGVSTADARALAPDMRTSADFILTQPRLHFACHIRNVTQGAVSIRIPVGEMERQPKLSDEAFEQLRDLSRFQLCLPKLIEGEGFTVDVEMPASFDGDLHRQEFRPSGQSADEPSGRAAPQSDPTAPGEW